MTDSYSWQNDSRPRPSVRIDAHAPGDTDIAFSLDDPDAEAVAATLAVFERLAGSLLHRGGAA